MTRALTLAAVLVLALAAPASAAPRFLQPLALSDPASGSPSSPSVAMAPDGDAVLAWGIAGQAVEYVLRPADGPFGAPVTLPREPGRSHRAFEVAVGESGAAAIAVVECVGSPCPAANIRLLLRPAGAPAFGEPIHVASLVPKSVVPEVDVAVTPQGEALIVWTEPADTVTRVRAARVRADGAVGPIFTLSNEARTALFEATGIRQVVVDRRGNAIVHWRESGVGAASPSSAFLTWWPAGGVPEPATEVALSPEAEAVIVRAAAMDDAGNALLVLEGLSSNCLFQAHRQAGPGKAAVASSQPLACHTKPAEVHLGADAAGTFTLLYRAADAGRMRVFLATRPAGASAAFTAPVRIDGSDADAAVGQVGFALARDGRAIVAWERVDNRVQALVREAAGKPFGPPVDLPGNPVNPPRVVTSDRDEALVALHESGGSGPFKVTVHPFGEPVPHIAGPATAAPGETVRFAARSPWAPLASATWSWSDGAPGGSGPAISRTFTDPGTYTLTLSGSDAAGNANTSRLTVTVAAPPARPPDPAGPRGSAKLRLRLSRRAKQRIGRTRAIVVTATCLGEPCTLRPTATVRVREARRKRTRTIRLKGARRRAEAGRRVRLTIRISRRTAKRLVRAAGRRGLKATVTVRATGRTATVTRRVGVVLRR